MIREYVLTLLLFILLSTVAFAQENGRLLLNVLDQNGDKVTNGVINIKNKKGKTILTKTILETKESPIILKTGRYILDIQAPGFKAIQKKVEIKKGENTLEIQFEVEAIIAELEVKQNERVQQVSRGFTEFLTQKEIDSLPEDGESIKAELKRRYGDDILIRIDGSLDGSQIPPRSQIQSIKVIRNAFDAEFHEIGRIIIDIRTSGVASNFGGYARLSINDSVLNAKNPFDLKRQPEQTKSLMLFSSVPLIKKKTSLGFSTFMIDKFDTQDFIGVIPNPNFDTQRKNKSRIAFYSLGIKHNLPGSHLLKLDYKNSGFKFSGLGVLDFPERASTRKNTKHTFQITESGIFKNKYVNDFRFFISKEFRDTIPKTDETSIVVLNAFNRGGSGYKNHRESTVIGFNDNLLFDVKKHSLKIGTEITYEFFQSVTENNLNGRFIFSSLEDFQNQQSAQYSRTTEATEIKLNQLRTSFYFQDYFNLNEAIQLSLGIRYEWQNDIKDYNNFSPRIGFAWSPEKSGRIVIRGGIGVFYDWLPTRIRSSIMRNDGRQGQSIIILNPNFPNPISNVGIFQQSLLNISKIAEDLKTPQIYVGQIATNLKLTNKTTLEGIYTFKRGLHHFRSRDINSPLNGVRPDLNFGRIRLLESTGMTRENSFELKVNHYYKGINFYGNYKLAKQTNDFSSPLSLPSDSYNLRLDQGNSNFDQRHKLNISASFNIGKRLQISPSFKLESGFPHTITTGRDDNGDTVFKDRPPNFARNSERGKMLKQTDLRINWKLPMKFFGLKKLDKRPVNLTMQVYNVFNTPNFLNYVGVQTSPFFKQPISARTPRTFDFSLSFMF